MSRSSAVFVVCRITQEADDNDAESETRAHVVGAHKTGWIIFGVDLRQHATYIRVVVVLFFFFPCAASLRPSLRPSFTRR